MDLTSMNIKILKREIGTINDELKKGLNESLESLKQAKEAKLAVLLEKLEKCGTFELIDVGYTLAHVVSVFEGEDYAFKRLDNRNTKQPEYYYVIEKANKSDENDDPLVLYTTSNFYDSQARLAVFNHEQGDFTTTFANANFPYLNDFIIYLSQYQADYNLPDKIRFSNQILVNLENQFIMSHFSDIDKLRQVRLTRDIENAKRNSQWQPNRKR